MQLLPNFLHKGHVAVNSLLSLHSNWKGWGSLSQFDQNMETAWIKEHVSVSLILNQNLIIRLYFTPTKFVTGSNSVYIF